MIVVDPGFVVDRVHSRPPNNRRTRINRNKRRTPPPGVALAMSCDECDAQGAGPGNYQLAVASMASRRAGRVVAQLARSALSAAGAPNPERDIAGGD
jgi:hypothetical protein